MYESVTGFYYLGSRYYDLETGRFINADISETVTVDYENMNQYNLFAYCFNNTVNMSDDTGTWPSWATKVIVGAVATIAAVTITVATGGAAAPLLLGVVASTLSGAAMGYISGGKEGAIEGAADGFMWGGIGALASSAVSAIKALNIAKQGVTIGEHMPSVKNAATLNNTATYKSMKGYNAVKKVFGQNVADKLSIYHNKVFIRRMRKLGAVIFDNGPHWSQSATSKWYIMEKQVLKGYSGLIKMY